VEDSFVLLALISTTKFNKVAQSAQDVENFFVCTWILIGSRKNFLASTRQ
jgi:hypothetical protein